MSRYEVRARAAAITFTTKPQPYFVTIFYILVVQLVAVLCMEAGGQPFMIDIEAAAAGDVENAILFVPENITALTTILLLAGQMLFVLMDVGYSSYCLHACRREKCSYFDLMDGFFVFFRAVILWFVKGMLISFGMMLFVVPGVIAAMIYSQSTRLLLDHPDWSVFACMRESRRLLRGRLREYFLLQLNLLIWNIGCAFPLVEVFARPCVQLSETVYYLALTGEVTPVEGPGNDEEKPPWEY